MFDFLSECTLRKLKGKNKNKYRAKLSLVSDVSRFNIFNAQKRYSKLNFIEYKIVTLCNKKFFLENLISVYGIDKTKDLNNGRFFKLESQNQWQPCSKIEASYRTVSPTISSAFYTNPTPESTLMTTMTSVLVKTTTTKSMQVHRSSCEKNLSAVFETSMKEFFE